jgi:hypothetical protein
MMIAIVSSFRGALPRFLLWLMLPPAVQSPPDTQQPAWRRWQGWLPHEALSRSISDPARQFLAVDQRREVVGRQTSGRLQFGKRRGIQAEAREVLAPPQSHQEVVWRQRYRFVQQRPRLLDVEPLQKEPCEDQAKLHVGRCLGQAGTQTGLRLNGQTRAEQPQRLVGLFRPAAHRRDRRSRRVLPEREV